MLQIKITLNLVQSIILFLLSRPTAVHWAESVSIWWWSQVVCCLCHRMQLLKVFSHRQSLWEGWLWRFFKTFFSTVFSHFQIFSVVFLDLLNRFQLLFSHFQPFITGCIRFPPLSVVFNSFQQFSTVFQCVQPCPAVLSHFAEFLDN